MRVVVTGDAGFIGSHVVERLLASGHEVFGVDDYSRGREGNLSIASKHKSFSHVDLDIQSSELAQALIEIVPQAVCHLAAQIEVGSSLSDPLNDARQNILGTINVLEACRQARTRRVVFASSGGSIYGTQSQLPVNEKQPLAPESPYAAGKIACEVYLGVYASLCGLEWAALALANVYGPRQDPAGGAGVVSIFGSAMLRGAPTFIFGDGLATRDFVYVEDVAEAFVLAVEATSVENRRLNIGTGKQITVAHLHSLLAGMIGASATVNYTDDRIGELRHISLDSALARRKLGWTPKVGLESGLEQTVAWLRLHQAE